MDVPSSGERGRQTLHVAAWLTISRFGYDSPNPAPRPRATRFDRPDPSTMREPVLIFDFGNVIAHFDYRLACDHLAEKTGLTADLLLGRLRTLAGSSLARRYESGQLSTEAFWNALRIEAGLESLSRQEFASAWCSIFRLNEPVARLIAALKADGFTLVLGSNTNELHAAYFRQQFA